MDPNACFEELLDAVASGEADLAREHAENLLDWLARGGFSPAAETLRLSAVEGFCRWAIATYSDER
jgi:hypothetical protein